MKKMVLFACDACGALTALPADSPHIEIDEDEVQPLGVCAILRETHADDNDSCIGTVAHVGTVSVE